MMILPWSQRHENAPTDQRSSDGLALPRSGRFPLHPTDTACACTMPARPASPCCLGTFPQGRPPAGLYRLRIISRRGIRRYYFSALLGRRGHAVPCSSVGHEPVIYGTVSPLSVSGIFQMAVCKHKPLQMMCFSCLLFSVCLLFCLCACLPAYLPIHACCLPLSLARSSLFPNGPNPIERQGLHGRHSR